MLTMVRHAVFDCQGPSSLETQRKKPVNGDARSRETKRINRPITGGERNAKELKPWVNNKSEEICLSHCCPMKAMILSET